MLLLLLLLGLNALFLVLHAVAFSRAPAELNYQEGTWLFAALRARYGAGLYFDYSQAPYIAMAYPPLAPELAGWLGALAGAPDRWVIALARLESLGATLATGGAIYVLCRALGTGRLPALIAALLFFTPTQTFQIWSYVARGDMLAVALGAWAVALLALAPAGRLGPLAAGVLAGLALASKQTALAPILACAWWLLPAARRRGLPWLVGGCAIGLALPFVPVGIEGTGLFLKGTLDLVAQPSYRAPFDMRLENLVTLFGLVIPLSALGIVACVANVSQPGPSPQISVQQARSGLVLRYAAMAGLVLVLTAGKIGSASSYLLELIAVLSVLAGMGLHWLGKLDVVPREVAMGVLALAFVPLFLQTWLALKVGQTWRDPPPDDRPIVEILGKYAGPVLSENGYVVLNGTTPPYLLDPLYFSVEASQGRWDASQVEQMVQQGGFSAILLTHPVENTPATQNIPWLPATITQAIEQHYQLEATQGRYYVYVPRR